MTEQQSYSSKHANTENILGDIEDETLTNSSDVSLISQQIANTCAQADKETLQKVKKHVEYTEYILCDLEHETPTTLSDGSLISQQITDIILEPSSTNTCSQTDKETLEKVKKHVENTQTNSSEESVNSRQLADITQIEFPSTNTCSKFKNHVENTENISEGLEDETLTLSSEESLNSQQIADIIQIESSTNACSQTDKENLEKFQELVTNKIL